jgi:hypothetical protein
MLTCVKKVLAPPMSRVLAIFLRYQVTLRYTVHIQPHAACGQGCLHFNLCFFKRGLQLKPTRGPWAACLPFIPVREPHPLCTHSLATGQELAVGIHADYHDRRVLGQLQELAHQPLIAPPHCNQPSSKQHTQQVHYQKAGCLHRTRYMAQACPAACASAWLFHCAHWSC